MYSAPMYFTGINKKEAFKSLMSTWARKIIPHSAMFCVHSVVSSNGQQVHEIVSDGLPQAFVQRIVSPDDRIRSPLYLATRENGMGRFAASAKIGENEDLCHTELCASGYETLVSYAHKTVDEYERTTFVGFFDVDAANMAASAESGDLLMPVLHAALTNIVKKVNLEKPKIKLTPGESAIVEFLKLGLSNKEIAKRVGRSERMVVHHVSNIMEKFQIKKRAVLAIELSKMS